MRGQGTDGRKVVQRIEGQGQAPRFAKGPGRQIVREVLPEAPDPPGEPPHRRVVEEQHLEDALQEIEEVVVAKDVGQFVGQQGLQVGLRQPREAGRGQQHHRAPHAERRRRGQARGDLQFHVGTQSHAETQGPQAGGPGRGGRPRLAPPAARGAPSARQTQGHERAPEGPRARDPREGTQQQLPTTVPPGGCHGQGCRPLDGRYGCGHALRQSAFPGPFQPVDEDGQGQRQTEQQSSPREGVLQPGTTRPGPAHQQRRGQAHQREHPEGVHQGPTEGHDEAGRVHHFPFRPSRVRMRPFSSSETAPAFSAACTSASALPPKTRSSRSDTRPDSISDRGWAAR